MATVFSDLLVEHGEGIKVELFYWFPQVELLLPVWHGHLRQEDDAEIDIVQDKGRAGLSQCRRQHAAVLTGKSARRSLAAF
jgi:hypothetical protein